MTDSAGVSRVAPLMYVSPTQINFVVPESTAAGPTSFAVSNGSGGQFNVTSPVQNVAPTLFSMSGDGKGVAAATALQVQASNSGLQSAVEVFQCGASGCVPVPIALGVDTPVVLTLYGTGIRNRSSLANVTVNINGVNAPVAYAGPQPSYEGLNQVNVTLPLSLGGSGLVNIVMTVDGQTSNVVTIDVM